MKNDNPKLYLGLILSLRIKKMTKENFTSINVIIDQSGSMDTLTNDTIGSFNTFLAEQKLVPGEAVFTLCTFGYTSNLVHDFIKLDTVPDLSTNTYRPSGGTALLDALGSTIKSVGARLAAMPEDERPENVIFLVITDGDENSSRTFTKEQVKSMVQHQQDVYKWEFVFIGANVDAFKEGQSLGFSASNSVSYDATSVGTKQLYNSVSSNVSSYRSSKLSDSVKGKLDFFGQTGVTPTADSTTPTVDNTLAGVGPVDPSQGETP